MNPHRNAQHPRRPAGPDPRRASAGTSISCRCSVRRDRPPRNRGPRPAAAAGEVRTTGHLRGLRLNCEPEASRGDAAGPGRPPLARRRRIGHSLRAGFGKTHVAQALGHHVTRRGGDVRFVKCARMLADLAGGHADRTIGQRMREYHPAAAADPLRALARERLRRAGRTVPAPASVVGTPDR
ncbi:conserved hypothetical protein (plasmid) [Rhodococcus jostii RHA1]|uniref:IstB-like ATP-binding domain-containing protein n=1 Tax=Rhodococcus jostii (strain RHA1) TaxID=101510 RepID=Q0S057_RHOJR|nr:conserved hypothetical protein [Rhodococcus jostii RHA1]